MKRDDRELVVIIVLLAAIVIALCSYLPGLMKYIDKIAEHSIVD